MKNMIKDALILFAITLVAGVLLGAVYQITKEPIARQEALALENACKEVFADAVSFEEDAFDAEAVNAFLADNGYNAQVIESVYLAKDGAGAVMGAVLTVKTSEGYGGDIRFTMGIRNDGTLNSISLLTISETPGLGMNAEAVLVPQFVNSKGYPFVVTKTQSTDAMEISAISGATITSEAVTGGVNAGMLYFTENMMEGGNS